MLRGEHLADGLRHFRGGRSVWRIVKIQQQNTHGTIVQGKTGSLRTRKKGQLDDFCPFEQFSGSFPPIRLKPPQTSVREVCMRKNFLLFVGSFSVLTVFWMACVSLEARSATLPQALLNAH